MLSIALHRLFEAQTARYAGSQARLVFYSGGIPRECEEQATGERIASVAASEELVRGFYRGDLPPLPAGATYWRILNNDGNCIMQGEGMIPAETAPNAQPDPAPAAAGP